MLVTCREIVGEIIRVFQYPKIKKNHHINDHKIKSLMDRIYLKAEMVEGGYPVQVLKDVDDNKFLSCQLKDRQITL